MTDHLTYLVLGLGGGAVIGALAGGFLPNAMGIGKQYAGSFSPGFLAGTALAISMLITLLWVTREWTSTWVGEGGKGSIYRLILNHSVHYSNR